MDTYLTAKLLKQGDGVAVHYIYCEGGIDNDLLDLKTVLQ